MYSSEQGGFLDFQNGVDEGGDVMYILPRG